MIKAEIKGKELVITLPIEEKASKTGKTIIIAGTPGITPTDLKYKGKIVSIGLNAMIPNR